MKYQYLYDSVLKTSIPVDEFKDEAEVAELLGHIGDAIRIWATLAKFGDKNAQTRLDDLTQGKDVYFAGCGEGINQNLCPHVHFDKILLMQRTVSFKIEYSKLFFLRSANRLCSVNWSLPAWCR